MRIVHGWAFPDADRLMSAEMRPDGTYQADHLHAALRHVTDFSCAVDGGAHVGTWSRLLAERFALVWAFEPAPDTFACLQRNMSEFGCTNVEPAAMALGAKQGTVRMALDAKQEARGNTGGRYALPGGDILAVPLDSLNLASLGFLKLDVEGGEVDALKGAEGTLRRCRPVVLFEDKAHWTRCGYGERAPHDLLTAWGFTPLERVGRDEIWGPA